MTAEGASAQVHGTAGQSLGASGARKYGAADASRGSFIERAVARGLEHWLSQRPDRAGLHLFHDLGGFHAVAGHGCGPISLGSANIDHVILSGAQWLLLDAKGMGAGTLTTDARGRGVLIQPDGTELPREWLDKTTGKSAAGVLFRLTGLRGRAVWVLPDVTAFDEQGIAKARVFKYDGTITHLSDVYSGGLDHLMPVPQPPADPEAVAALARYADAATPAPRGAG